MKWNGGGKIRIHVALRWLDADKIILIAISIPHLIPILQLISFGTIVKLHLDSLIYEQLSELRRCVS